MAYSAGLRKRAGQGVRCNSATPAQAAPTLSQLPGFHTHVESQQGQ